MKRLQPIALLVGLSLLAAACGNAPGQGGDGGDGADGGLSGSVAIDGSSTVGPLTDAIAEEYAAEQPDVTVNLSISGTGGGFERFCGVGDTDISNASRPIKQEEADLCAENGIEFVEVRVGTDALTMVVNPRSDFVDCLTTEEVTRIFGPDAPATSWNQVRDGLPDTPLQVFAPGTDSGTYDFMVEDVLGLGGSRQDYNASEDDNIIVQGVAGTPGAWGFFGFAFFQQNQGQLKALAYDAGAGCVEPSVETAQDDTYEMARPLFVYVKEQSLIEQEHVADFVRFYLDHVDEVIEDVGYIPVPEETIEDARQKVEEATSG
ncbi:MAG: PstS family phosphate ABC transporter substrate-binding protein [Nitriliruptorales bacterium]